LRHLVLGKWRCCVCWSSWISFNYFHVFIFCSQNWTRTRLGLHTLLSCAP
jgi:hypothetical protein